MTREQRNERSEDAAATLARYVEDGEGDQDEVQKAREWLAGHDDWQRLARILRRAA